MYVQEGASDVNRRRCRGQQARDSQMSVEERLKEKPPRLFVALGWEAQLSFQASGAAPACCRQACRCFTSARARLHWFAQRKRKCFGRADVDASWRMRANRAGRNESLPRVSDEVAGFQVSPLGYMWAAVTGPCLRARCRQAR